MTTDNIPFSLERARAGDEIEVDLGVLWQEVLFVGQRRNKNVVYELSPDDHGSLKEVNIINVRMKRKTVTKYLNVWLSEEDITGVEAFLYDYKDVAEKISDPDSRPLILKCHPIEVPID